jgi:hypothetical protein
MKKYNVKTSKSNENITDIMNEFKNDENAIKKNIKKNIQKIKNPKKQSDKSDSSDLSKSTEDSKSSDDIKIDHKKIEEKNKENLIKLAVIDKICNKHPNIRKDKKNLIEEIIMEDKKKLDKKDYNNVYTLDKLIINEKTYYKDENNNILDENIKLVGFYRDLGVQYEAIMFPLILSQ